MTRRAMKSKSGVITILVVYKDSIQVGCGYMLYDYRGAHEPVLTSNGGLDLHPDTYSLVATEERLVVVNDRIQ